MLRHCVLFRWSESAGEAKRQGLREALGTLPGLIPEIRSFSIGEDAGLGVDNYDFLVVADFDDADAYKVYAEHPAHVAVIQEHIRPSTSSKAGVQYEV